ncbi:MAG TPA: dihydrofolate reductase family protein [Acidimicrobiales bacterium]|nr:dihydrofolate reductase family protein [Acidimicrobiales bacterium]
MTTIESLLERYEAARPAHPDRPWVLLNLVLSADGHASVGGRVTQLTSPTDQTLFHHLRTLSDVILVGASTVRAEKYGPVRITDEVARRRVANGRPERPTLVIVSRSLDLDLRAIVDAGQSVVVMTCAASDAELRARIEESADVIVVGDEIVDLRRGLGLLHERGAQVVLCEGGAVLNGELAQAELIDEVCVTVAPVLGGDPSTRSGALQHHLLRMELQQAHTVDGNVFLRWTVV